MVEYTIQLTDEQAAALSEQASAAGLAPRDQLQADVQNLFDERRSRIQRHIKDIISEHKGLYERLA